MVGMSKEGAAPRLSRVQGPPCVQRATIRDVFDPTAILDEPLFSHHVFKLVFIDRKSTRLNSSH